MVAHRIVLVAVTAVALWGCGSDSDSDAEVSSAPTVADDPAPSVVDDPDVTSSDNGGTGAPQGDAEIVIADFSFTGDQEVAAGAPVVVTNTDTASHTWTAVDGPFDSGTIAGGDSFEFTFDEPGTFEYVCEIHPSMTGSITVTA